MTNRKPGLLASFYRGQAILSVKSSVPALQMNPPSLQSGAHSSRPVAHIGTHANHAHRTLDLELWDAQFVGHCRNHLQTRHLSVSDDVR